MTKRKRPQKIKVPRVCHTCKYFEHDEENIKYSDGICTCSFIKGGRKELFESCSRWSTAPGVRLRTDWLLTSKSLLNRIDNMTQEFMNKHTDKKDILQALRNLQRMLEDIIGVLLLTRVLTDEQLNMLTKLCDIFDHAREVGLLETQWQLPPFEK